MDKCVLVTGGNRGIGLEMARQLSQRNCNVFVACRSRVAGEKAVAKITPGKGQIRVIEMDVSDDRSIRSAFEEYRKHASRLHVLINNAGIYPDEDSETIMEVPRERFVEAFQTNAFGPVRVVQEFLTVLREARGARIINVSSGYGQLNGLSAKVPAYCLSKLTLNGVTVMLHQALSGESFSVNSMCPGWVRTDMGGPNAPRSVEQGADTAVWLACDAPQSLSGKFFRDRKEIPW